MLYKIGKNKGYDINGNLWNGDTLAQKPPITINSSKEFWCIVCKDVRPLTVAGGMIGSVEIGGYMCKAHEITLKNHLVWLQKS